MGLAAIQAVVSKAHILGRLVQRRQSQVEISPELVTARRNSEMSLEEQIREVKEATGNTCPTGCLVHCLPSSLAAWLPDWLAHWLAHCKRLSQCV